jgi:hypothetical protein
MDVHVRKNPKETNLTEGGTYNEMRKWGFGAHVSWTVCEFFEQRKFVTMHQGEGAMCGLGNAIKDSGPTRMHTQAESV